MFQRRFIWPIFLGIKVTTMRENARCKPGDELSLRCWRGAPYRSRHMGLVQVPCTQVQNVTLDASGRFWLGLDIVDAPDLLAVLARNEGFASYAELLSWFRENHTLPFGGSLIGW